jgi:hypothetical protein
VIRQVLDRMTGGASRKPRLAGGALHDEIRKLSPEPLKIQQMQSNL